jgi:hypothetical protein
MYARNGSSHSITACLGLPPGHPSYECQGYPLLSRLASSMQILAVMICWGEKERLHQGLEKSTKGGSPGK